MTTRCMRTRVLTHFLPGILTLVAPAAGLSQGAPLQAEPDSLPPGITMEMIREGRAIFEGPGLCTSCHGDAGQGLIGPDLTDNNWLQAKGTYLSILQVVASGVAEERSATGTAMPARGGSMTIDDADVHAVVAYVWTKSHPDADHLPPGVSAEIVESGREIFAGPGNCAKCHGEDATGLVGPDLTDDVWLDAKGSYLAIGRLIVNGVSESESTRGIPMPPKGGSAITEAEIERVAAYVWYLSHQ